MFEPSKRTGGSKRPSQYYCFKTLGRIKQVDLNRLRANFNNDSFIMNGLKMDSAYQPTASDLAEYYDEMLQHWEAYKAISSEFENKNISENVRLMRNKINSAIGNIKTFNKSLRDTIDIDELQTMLQAIDIFVDNAEIA